MDDVADLKNANGAVGRRCLGFANHRCNGPENLP
jgi:hypothetical protein